MIECSKATCIGSSDYGSVWLKRVGANIYLKRYHPKEYSDMEEYIRETHDTLSEWQSDAYNWHTEQSYEEWMQDYDYRYEDYFEYDSDTDEYYDYDDSDTLICYWYCCDRPKNELIDIVVSWFNDDYDNWEFEFYNFDDYSFMELIWRYYDECVAYEKQIEEAKKPHWNVFNYYK